MAKTILFVDDSESIRKLVKYTLTEVGFEVLLSDDGVNAIKLFNGQQIDMLITDLHMEKMNGVELTKQVRTLKEYSHIPILVLTTESQVSKKIEAKEAGATGWIIKPFDSANLIKVVNKLIR